jgi:hypothetical protein
LNYQPHRATNRKPISVADACSSSFINDCDPAVYCYPSENSRFSDIPIGAASELIFILSERDYLSYLAKLYGAEPALRGDGPERRVFSSCLGQLSKYFRRRHAMITFYDRSEFSQATVAIRVGSALAGERVERHDNVTRISVWRHPMSVALRSKPAVSLPGRTVGRGDG